MKDRISLDTLVGVYKAEYLRTNGKEADVQPHKSPHWVYINGEATRKFRLPGLIEVLKGRPDAKKNLLGESVTPEKLTFKGEGVDWLCLFRGKKFVGYVARNGWNGKTALINYDKNVPVLMGTTGENLSVQEMRELVHECNKFFGYGGRFSGFPDVYGAMAHAIDGALQRAGIVWPCHETAAMLRKAANDFYLGEGQ
jgi:hypothetical protein